MISKIEVIPRCFNAREGLAKGKRAMVYFAPTGELCVLIDEVGLVTVEETDIMFNEDPFYYPMTD